MRHLNPFYFAVILVGLCLVYFLRPHSEPELSFYGFAESNETKVNYNYPVVVSKIMVTPGQSVKQGEVILELMRLKSKEVLADEEYRIAELEAESILWTQKQENEKLELELKKEITISEYDSKINSLQKELDFNISLSKDLTSISPDSSAYKPIQDKIVLLNEEKIRRVQSFDLMIENINKELLIGDHPYSEQIRRLRAEQAFDDNQKIQLITVEAPSDGLIGSIACKEAEHIPSYATLLSFYEPHSNVVKGYVHEDLTLQVNIGDSFVVTSLKDETIQYTGKAIGLGSRIVEIPTRLRKMPNIKSYGREVLVEVSIENSFLQKEKVSLSIVPSSMQAHD